MYTQAIEATGKSYGHLAKCAYVSSRYDFLHRCKNLSWKHHLEAARLDGEPRKRLLKAAEDLHLSASTIQAVVRVPPEAVTPARGLSPGWAPTTSEPPSLWRGPSGAKFA